MLGFGKCVVAVGLIADIWPSSEIALMADELFKLKLISRGLAITSTTYSFYLGLISNSIIFSIVSIVFNYLIFVI